jgi:hypothetical protein
MRDPSYGISNHRRSTSTAVRTKRIADQTTAGQQCGTLAEFGTLVPLRKQEECTRKEGSLDKAAACISQ